MAVATLAVVTDLLMFPLVWVLVPVMGYKSGLDVGLVLSIFLAIVITGYIFAGKIWETRMRAIAKITVLAAFVMTFTVMVEAAALRDWTAWIKEQYTGTTPTSAFEWYVVESMYLYAEKFVVIAGALVVTFIGLYIGSMFK